jgi:hypothetical protein
MEMQGKMGKKCQQEIVCSKNSQIVRFFAFIRLKTRYFSNLMRQPWGHGATEVVLLGK